MGIRTRIAPSPTGKFHIGTARTALFNYLYAKKQGGDFIVRIEDTDESRSAKEYERDILEGLEWLGLSADEGVFLAGEQGDKGPYRQSERKSVYRPYLEKLLQEGKAYYCDVPAEEIEKLRQEAEQDKKPFIFRGDRTKKCDPTKSVIRFAVPQSAIIKFDDLIKGEISFEAGLLGDFVIAKDLDSPLYNFVVVVDDELMAISHIIRGEDHISNTPKQILINMALGFGRKKYGHLPLILAPDRSKMSKRFGAVAVSEYKSEGYLPEAMINYLALLGWSESNDREFYSLEELIDKFSFKRVQKSGAVFSIEKLKSVNSHYLKSLPFEEQKSKVKEFLVKKNLDLSIFDDEQMDLLVKIEIERVACLSEVGTETAFVWLISDYDGQNLIWKQSDKAKTLQKLEDLYKELYNYEKGDYRLEILEQKVKSFIEKNNFSNGEILWPMRVALTGLTKSPSPFEAGVLLGKERVLDRISLAISKLATL
jgi:glutamyl-tRNA synthetase